MFVCYFFFFFFQAEDGIRYLVRSRGLGDVYKRQALSFRQNIAIKINKLLTEIYIAIFYLQEVYASYKDILPSVRPK